MRLSYPYLKHAYNFSRKKSPSASIGLNYFDFQGTECYFQIPELLFFNIEPQETVYFLMCEYRRLVTQKNHHVPFEFHI